MTRFHLFSLAVLLVATSAMAQLSLTRPRPIDGMNPGCRVDLQADRAGSVWERKLVKNPAVVPNSPSVNSALQQRLHLTLTNRTSRAIVGVALSVHGFSDRSRYVSLSATGPEPDRTQQVRISLDLQGNEHALRDLALQRFAAITLIDITSVTFADSSVWRPDAAGTCSVAPSSLMLASSGR